MSTHILSNFGVQHPRPSDDQLVSEAKSGDQRAFAELCLRYSGMLKHRIFRIVRHREDAEDVLQETLLKVYRHLNSFRGKSRFSTWIMKIGINTSIMLLRKRKTVFKHTADFVAENGERFETPEFRDPQPSPEQLFMMRQTLQRVRHAIRKLPPQLHAVVDLYYRRDRSVKDAAKTLGITEDVAKSRMLRARRLLRRSLKNQKLSNS